MEKPAATIKPKTSEVQNRGKTHIADEVVSVIARIAAEEVEGVHQLGESSLRGVFSRMGRHAGIASEVGLKEAAIDVEIVVEYGFPIARVADTLRKVIIESVEFMTGRRVVEVNVNVIDVFVPKSEIQKKRNLE